MLKAIAASVLRFVLRLFLTPILKSVPSMPGVRRLSAAVYRGRKAFGVPRHKTLIVLSELVRPGQTQASVAPYDENAADELARMFEALGYRRDTDWEVRRGSALLSDSDRRQNVILICSSNPNFLELLKERPRTLQNVHYNHSAKREERYFTWQNRRFRWTDTEDFALLAVKRNPFRPQRKLILLCGLRDIGTRAAAKVFSSSDYSDLRREIDAEHTMGSGEVEILLRVSHPIKRESITNIRVAGFEDGESLIGPPRLGPIHNDVRALNRVYLSLDQYPRLAKINDSVYEITYTADYGVRFRREYTISYGDSDIVVLGRRIGTDVPLANIDETHFEAKVLKGGGEIAALAATNEDTRKEFLLFPIPPIRKGDAPRKFQDTALWPNAGRKLRLVGGVDHHSYRVPQQSFGPVDKMTIRISSEIPDATFVVDFAFQSTSGVTRSTMSYQTPFEYVQNDVPAGTEFRFVCERIR